MERSQEWIANSPQIEKVQAQPTQAALNQRNQELITLHRISELMLKPQSLQACLQAIAAEVSTTTEFPIAAIELYDETRQVMVFAGVQGIPLPPGQSVLEVPVAETLSGQVVRSRQPVVKLYAPQEAKHCDANATLSQLGLQTFICLPLATEHRSIGTLSLADPGLRTVDDALIRWLSSLANYLAVLIDRKQAERALQENQQKLAALIDSLPGIAFSCNNDPDWSMTYLSEGCLAITGYPSSELVGPNRRLSYNDIVHPEDLVATLKMIQAAVNQQQPYVMEYRIQTKLGEEKWLWEKGRGIFDAQGNLLSLEGFITDITERKRAELVLRNLAEGVSAETGEAFFQSLVRYLAELLGTRFAIVTEVFGEHRNRAKTLAVYADGQIEMNFDYDLVGTPCEQVVEGQICFYPSGVQQLFPQDRLLVEMGIDSYLGIPLINGTGSCLGLLAVMDNQPLTNRPLAESMLKIFAVRATAELERKWAEEALARQAQELAISNAELEQFAYVASHDLQEPLRMVSSYIQLLARRYRGRLDQDADEFIGYAVDGVARMKTLINDLLDYSRIGTRSSEFDLTNFQEVWQRSLANLKLAIAETEAVLTHDPLPIVVADSSQLVQLLQNLIGNALKFRGQEPPQVHLAVQEREREWLFSLQDNGIGIAPEYADRIFVLFQRLHPRNVYPGTGIGLAICKKIIERHHGKIWLSSQPGKGSVFHFSIPK